MGFLSKFEGKMEDAFEGTANKMFGSPISPVQIAKKSERQMRREKMVGAGKQYAPTLYTVLVNPDDDERLFGYYPTLAGETETYLVAKAADEGLVMDGQPLVRFIVDDGLKRGKFDVIAEAVAAPVVEQLRAEEFERYGIAPVSYARGRARAGRGYAAGGRRGSDEYGHDDYDGSAEEGAGDNTVVLVGGGAAPAREGAAQARLIDTAAHKEYVLSSMRLLVGRESTSDIVVRDPNVSRTHAELRLERGNSWVLTDLGSTNGTFVNGREVTAQALRDGDRIAMGMTTFVFSLT